MWAKLDDGFHSHPKIIRVGNAAAGLLARVISYAGQHLTDGVVPGAVVREYGTGPQITKLSAVGLLHARGHECARCAQPDAGDFIVHDFLVSNPSRAKVDGDRERAADRQRQSRQVRTGDDSPPVRARNGADSSPNRARNDADSTPGFQAASQVKGGRHAERLARAHVDPTRPDPGSIPDGIEPSPLPPPERPRADAPGVPPFAQPLADQLSAAGCHLQWRTDSTDRVALRRHLDRVPVPRLVDAARRAWNPANPPRSIRYLIKVWEGVADTPADAPDSPAPATAPDMFDRAMQRAHARMAAHDTTHQPPRALTA
ncbi:mucin-2 [Streptomyces syringium]|uniref:mucin-2 n=1 Tax=Streptomyces syringium TaxID=76729 RepID=UPI0033FB29E5